MIADWGGYVQYVHHQASRQTVTRLTILSTQITRRKIITTHAALVEGVPLDYLALCTSVHGGEVDPRI